MKQRRVMLKLSGEALAEHSSYDDEKIRSIARQVKTETDKGTQVGIVIGGGNYWRGRSAGDMDRTKADQIGMLATVLNCIYVSERFREEGMKTVIMTPFICGSMTELFSKDKAVGYFESGHVIFFAGGTGHPFFSTDTGLVLKAAELDADMVLLAKSIDGIYNADPAKHPDAVRYDKVSIDEVIAKNLQAIDMTASVLARDNKIPLTVFDMNEEGSIAAALAGTVRGTVVTV